MKTIRTPQWGGQPNELKRRIQKALRLLFAGATAICITAPSAAGQIWETIDDVPGATSNGILSDPSGNIYIVGSIKTATNVTRAIVLKSVDQGDHWDMNPSSPGDDPSDSFSSADGTSASFLGIESATVSRNGSTAVHLVTTGLANSNSWLVRRSLDEGATWTTLSLFKPAKTYESTGITKPAIDSAGNVYIGGSVSERVKGKSVTRHLIRRLTGNSWTTIQTNFGIKRIFCVGTDIFACTQTATEMRVLKSIDGGLNWSLLVTPISGPFASGDLTIWDITVDHLGNLYLVGWENRSITTSSGTLWERLWITHKCTLDGTQWSEFEKFAPPRTPVPWVDGSFFGRSSWAWSVAVDLQGNVYVTGVGVEDEEGQHWLTRRLAFGDTAFRSDDDYMVSNSSDMTGKHIAVDPSGNVFATGKISGTSNGLQEWVVRRRLMGE